MKVSPLGDRVLLGGYFAGSEYLCSGSSTCALAERSTSGVDIALDSQDNILLAGNTNVRGLPGGVGPGPFVAKIRQGGSPGLDWLKGISSGVGIPAPSPLSSATSMTVSSAGELYLAGATGDAAFPATPGTIQTLYSGPLSQGTTDGFILKLSSAGTLVWSTFIGEPDVSESVQSLGLDSTGSLWASLGAGTSRDRLIRLAADGSRVLYSEEARSNLSRAIPAHIAETIVLGGNPYGNSTGIIRGLRVSQTDTRRIAAIANSANQAAAPLVSPGQLLTLFGPGIGTEGSEVFFGTAKSPILFAGQNQINVIVPTDVAAGSPVVIEVQKAAVTPVRYLAEVVNAAPELFQRPDGSAVALNQDGTLNSAGNPAAPGSIVVLYATGTGTDGRPAGTIATEPLERNCCKIVRRIAAFPGDELQVLYSGDAPGLVTALTQINVRLPEAGGNVQLGLAGSRFTVLVYVR